MPQRLLLTLWLCLLGASRAFSAGTPPTVHGRLSLRETAETNVFLQDNVALAAGQTQAALPARADDFSFSVNPALEFAWKPSARLNLEAAYAPEFVRYARFASENHDDHRFTFTLAGTGAAWRGEVRASALLTDGSTEPPVFNRLGGTPSIGGEPVRARRAQDVFKLGAQLTRTGPHGFVRGICALSQQDFHTAERTTPGCANYVDRGENSAGLDAGWYVREKFALVAGARLGRQNQATLLGNPLQYTNTLQRWLLGCEGTPHRWLKLSFLAGPDRRQYGSAVAAGFDRHRTTLYGEGNVVWTTGKGDSVTLSGKNYAWVSSGGRGAYVDSVSELAWKHRFNPAWSGQASFNHHTGDSRRYNPSAPRHDRIESARLALSRSGGPVTFEAAWLHEWSASAIPHTPGRAYRRELVSLGAGRAW